jgi:hypothetical protein
MHLPRIIAALAIASAGAGVRPAIAQETLEYPVKAAFLVRFGDYVDWPATAFASPSAPLQLCVVGEDPFGSALEKAARSQQSHGRTISVKHLKSARADSGCHIVYLAPSEAARAAQQLDAMRSAPVLTVTDFRSPPTGIINFVVKEERVRFDIDDEAALQGGLSISSKLLALALNVRPRRGAR